MSLRLLADENVDDRLVYRLTQAGHDVEHVDFVPELGKGSSDEEIAAHSRETGRILVSSDADFLSDFDPEDYQGLLFIEDETLSPGDATAIINAISEQVSSSQVEAVLYVSESWL